MTIPTPYLEYAFYGTDRPDPTDVVPEPGSPRVASVSAVNVWAGSDGLRVVVNGPLLKRDGTPGRHMRGCMVDLSQTQPDWLVDLIADALARLSLQGVSR